MEDLPADLMIDILSRLAVKTIVHCKCVCKKWRNLVLHSYFVNLHLSRSPTGLIIHYHNRNIYNDPDPGILKWVEIEDKVDHHHLHHNPFTNLHLNLAPILQNSLIDQVGSVNGLICLWQYSPALDNIYICNPITREYMILPSHPYYRQGYGFGVSSLTGEYKVVRISKVDVSPNGNKPSWERVLEAEVYTLGTGQWKSLGRVPYRLNGFYGFYAALLNGYCHWIVCDQKDDLKKLITFDLDKETFQLFPSPPIEGIDPSLGVLKGCLCEIDTSENQITIWVMKEYGIKESWHKELVITEEISRYLKLPMWDAMSLTEGLNLKDGSILTICDGKLWTFYPRSETIEVTEMVEFLASGLAYRPSFLQLQNFELERVHIF